MKVQENLLEVIPAEGQDHLSGAKAYKVVRTISIFFQI